MQRFLKYFFLVTLFLFSFRVLDRLPLPLINEVVAVGIGLALVFVLYYYVVRRLLIMNLSYSVFELYVLALMMVPFITALRAHDTFGQPLLYGILTQRSIWIASCVLVVLVSLRHGLFTLKELEKVVVGTAWVLLALYFVVTVSVDPKLYEDVPSFVAREGADEYKFKFQPSLIVFGFLYYCCKAVRIKEIRYLYISIPFLVFLGVVHQGRSLLLAMFLALLYFVYRRSSTTRLAVLFAKSIVVVTVGLGILYLSNESLISRLSEKYTDAFTVVITGAHTKDTSANARIIETNAALPYVRKNWFFGSGDLSHRWDGGYSSRLGYFYTSDIGVIGIIFVYGVAGAILFYLQYVFAIRYSNAHSERQHIALIDASKAFLFYLFLQSFVTGIIAFSPSISLFFIALLYSSSCFRELRRSPFPIDQQNDTSIDALDSRRPSSRAHL